MGIWFEDFALVVADGKLLTRPQKPIDGIEFPDVSSLLEDHLCP